MISGGSERAAIGRQAVVACQVCSQDQTLTDVVIEEARDGQVRDQVYLMECCFSIVCKECVGVIGSHAQAAVMPSANEDETQIEESLPAAKAQHQRICLACLEPTRLGGEGSGSRLLTFAKYQVLVSLLASLNEAGKQATASTRDSSSIFNFITGSSKANQQSKLCQRCQLHEHRFICQTCGGGDTSTAIKLCQDCHTLIHSLGSAFKSHKVFESPGPVAQVDESGGQENKDKELHITTLIELQECLRHQETIEYYVEEDEDDGVDQIDGALQLPAVLYGCQKCVTTQQGMTKIDKENLLNVFSLKQEVFKERQKSQATLSSMLANFNLDIVEKLPELRRLESQQVQNVITRLVKTLYNKQREIEQQIEDKFQKLADHVHKEKQRMLTKKDVIERNYNLLEKALEVVPLQILSCEEGLLEAVLMSNQGLMKVVRRQEAKLLQRQAQLAQPAANEDAKFEAPFHLIQPDQKKLRLQQLESFATRIDTIVTELFKQASDSLEQAQQFSSPTPAEVQFLNVPPTPLEPMAPMTIQSTPMTVPLTSQDTNAGTGVADSYQGGMNQSASTEPKRQSVQSTRTSVLAAFVTQQNQVAKPRMSRDSLTKSHMSIGHHTSFNQLDMSAQDAHRSKVTEQSQRSGKGGTSRRDASHNAANRNGSQSATAAHQAYLQTASQRNSSIAGTAAKSQTALKTSTAAAAAAAATAAAAAAATANINSTPGSSSLTNKWDASTRINKQLRDNSTSSQNQQPAGQSVPRGYQGTQGKDRSQHRPSLNTGLRNGAHSAVGQSERWTANTQKRNSNCDTSQELGASGANDLQNQKNAPGDNSPRLSRNRISMNNIVANKQVDPEKLVIKENIAVIEQNCLASRVFTHVAQTSTAIQVAWSHPSNFQKVMTVEDENGRQVQKRQHIQYVLEYGIGVKVDNREQFRQIYKGKAHKCIITDLMPRTTFRLRVAPILNIEQPPNAQDQYASTTSEATDARKSVAVVQEQGEWSEVTNITTKETQTFDVGGTGQKAASTPKAPNLLCAQIVSKGRRKWLAFEKAGTVMAIYGYSFGEHLWILKIMYQEQQHQNPAHAGAQAANSALDQSGSMVVGVINKRFSTQKMFGSLINYSLFKGEVVVKIYLDSNKKRLIIYSPQYPQGDIFTDLPKDGLFFPAVQNKTAVTKHKSALKVFYKFEQPVPKEKAEIGSNLVYSSDDGGFDNTTDEMSSSNALAQNASMQGGGGPPQSANQSISHSREESKRQSRGTRGDAQ